jgi:propanediol utilization protein
LFLVDSPVFSIRFHPELSEILCMVSPPASTRALAARTLRTVPRERVAAIVAEVLAEKLAARAPAATTPATPAGDRAPAPLVVNISVRHMHITAAHLEVLFGPGAELTPQRWLYQQGQYAAQQTVDVIGPKRRILREVRILGPVRDHSQIELAFSDAIMLGIDVPVRMSGNVKGTPGCIVMGPKGHIVLPEGVIRAQRHVHLSPADAARFGVAAGDELELVVEHPSCPAVLGGVIARVHPTFRLEVHMDSDEGNACDLPRASGVALRKARG